MWCVALLYFSPRRWKQQRKSLLLSTRLSSNSLLASPFMLSLAEHAMHAYERATSGFKLPSWNLCGLCSLDSGSTYLDCERTNNKKSSPSGNIILYSFVVHYFVNVLHILKKKVASPMFGSLSVSCLIKLLLNLGVLLRNNGQFGVQLKQDSL